MNFTPHITLIALLLNSALILSLSETHATEAAENPDESSIPSVPAGNFSVSWIEVDEAQSSAPEACSIQCVLCEGYYSSYEPRDLDISAQVDGSIKAAANGYGYDANGNATLTGDVVLQQSTLQLEAEEVFVDQLQQQVTATGNVRLSDETFLLEGDNALVKLKAKTARIANATYRSKSNGARGQAEVLETKDQGKTLVIRRGYYTSCPESHEDWTIRGKKITLNQTTGWGSAKHMRINFKGIPLFYAPYLRFPIDDRRQTGLLLPSLDLQEPDIAQPIYFNLAPNYDATLTPRFVGERGNMLESEFRYLMPWGAGEFNGGYLDDDTSFSNEDRKLFSWQHQSFWENNWAFTADTTYVSDNDYFDNFGSSLSTNSESHLLREAQLSYRNQFGRNNALTTELSLIVQAFQTIDPGIEDSNRPYRKLPDLDLSLNWALNSAWNWQQQVELVRFEQLFSTTFQESDRGRYHSLMSYRWENAWAYLMPAVELNHVSYQHRQSTQAVLDNQSLSVPTAWIDSGLFFERKTGKRDNSLIQTLEPRLYALWTPEREQNNNPVFDTTAATFDYNQLFRSNRFIGGDRFGDNRQISLAVSSRLVDTTTGNDIFTASIGQAIYLEDRTVQLTDASPDTDDVSPVAGQLSWKPNQQWEMRSETQWNSDSNKFIGTTSSVSFLAPDRWNRTAHLVNVSHNYVSNANGAARIEQADISTANLISKEWSIYTRWLYDLNNDKTLEQLTGFSYESCCWRASLLYQRRIADAELVSTERNDYALLLQLELKGLAQLGGTLQGVLDDGIDNYADRFEKPFN